MLKRLDARNFDLPPSSLIEELDEQNYALVMDRKSRIIMADGKKIVAKAEKIKKHKPGATVFLKTTAPVCSKTINLLQEHGIAILPYSHP